ncbi:MAG: Unknown protein [uncultured Sulfurovum sp.]|uniref:Uncharacterized protein n=1 Tax=uncultured Sulfurovum sp. TaxID=269237 RepID=A0A6S6SP55_9BACT|nr:MAG: Unknown protein [uncultured Sulfurovum sp.]
MDYKDQSELKNKRLREKFNYIIEQHIPGGKRALAIETFGYERENQVSNLCAINHKPSIKKMHMESMEKHHQIPLTVWDNDLDFNKRKIDQHINTYKASLKAERISFEEEDNIFTNDKKLFEHLKGVWYAYLYPSNPSSAKETEGIWIVKTTINDDYTVIDYWGNAGYLKIGQEQSLIIKQPYENNDLTVIRFSNRHVSFEHFRFTIISNQNGTINEMVNFGFYARKKYTPQEAKEILGDIKKVQLKLDSGFDGRLNEQGIVKY